MSIRKAHKSSTIWATEGLTKRGFAKFVDNVDTRARIQIHLSLSILEYLTAWPVRRCWWRWGTTITIDNIDKVPVAGPPQKKFPPESKTPQKHFYFFVPRPPRRVTIRTQSGVIISIT
jgi:hypothetical protein